jgi:hypothetical protein
MPSSQPLVLHTELVAAAFDPEARYLWLVGHDGGPQAAYIGANDRGKARWLKATAEALTGMRLTGQGNGVEWLDSRQRHGALEEVRRLLSNEAADVDPRASRIKERMSGMLAIK